MDREPPTPDEVRAQLERILASEPFATATRLRRFLRYVVERSLAGEGEQIKEYAIGVEVFDRDGQYDPRIDSIVRVEAGRLRAKLDEHEHGAGAMDAVRIRIPRGSYAPVFERRERNVTAPAAPVPTPVPDRRATTWRPVLAVLAIGLLLASIVAWRTRAGASGASAGVARLAVFPFASYSTDAADQMLAARLTDGVTSELARLGALGVVSRTTAQRAAAAPRSVREIAQTLNVDFVIEGTVETSGDVVRVDARVVDALVDLKSGGERIEGRRGDLAKLQRDVAAAIAAAVQRRGARD